MTTLTVKTPWHLWLVGILATLWNAIGPYDYVMTQTRGETYLREMKFDDAQIAHVLGYPAWMEAVWAVGVWGAIVGSLLILIRMKLAALVLAASWIAFVVSLIYTYALSKGGEVMGQTGIIFNVIIFVIGAFLVWYAWTMGKRGVLR